MATSLGNLRAKLARRVDPDFRTGTTSGAGAAGGTTVVDTALADRRDDVYIDGYVKVTSGTPTGRKRISDFVQSTGTLTVYAAYSGQILSGKTYELYRVDPDLLDVALKEILRQVYPFFHKPFFDDTLITGNWLRNASFEDWTVATTPDNWLGSNTTLSKETTIIRHGASSLKHVSTGANSYVEQSETQLPRLLDVRGGIPTIRGWAYTSTASHARLRVVTVDDGGTTTTTNSDYHTGSGRWEILEVKPVIPLALRSLSLRLMGVVDAATVYWDAARLYAGNVYDYFLPATGWQNIQLVDIGGTSSQEADTDPCDDRGRNQSLTQVLDYDITDDGTDKRLFLHENYSKGRKIVLRGMDYLSQPASDTATTELDEPRTDAVVDLAAHWLYTNYYASLPADDVSRARVLAKEYKDLFKEVVRAHGMPVPFRARLRQW